MDETKLPEDSPRAADVSTELRAMVLLEENQNVYFSVMLAQLARNYAAIMTSINLQKAILAALGAGSPEEIEAHVRRTYDSWHSAALENTESLIDELSRYEGLDEQKP